MYLQILLETFSVTGPIFILVIVGLVLRRTGFIDDHFVQISSRLVFSLCLPILLFTTISEIDLNETVNPVLLSFALVASILTFVLSWGVAPFIQPRADRGVFIQGAFRSNLGVIGLALCANAYGPEGLALASILMAILTVSYNVLSVMALSNYANATFNWRSLLKDILTNPLIVAIAIATLVAIIQIPIPQFLKSSGNYLGQLALPLALLSAGATMNLRTLRESGTTTFIVVLLKALVLPGLVTIAAIATGFTPKETGVLFLLFVSPTATASYVMVKAMGGNDELAANLIMVTTLTVIFTASLGLFILRVNGYA
ncbi:MAG: putative permease [Candidatus Azotimanducaceae bacterium]|jgi:predicted permease